jgi:AraC-like DNA-binding protein
VTSERRDLPLYEAGSVAVPFVTRGFREHIRVSTEWGEHSHPTHELLWNDHGASTARVGPRTWTVTPLVGLWIPAGVVHTGHAPAGTRQRAVQFSLVDSVAIAPGPTAVDITDLLRLLLDRIDDETLDDEALARTEAMVLDVLRPAPRELMLRMPESDLLRPIVDALTADPADATTLAAWADRLGVSSRTVTRAFTAETGLGFTRWIAAFRAHAAIELLAEGSRVDDVAERMGFRSPSAFGTAFRRVTGTSPGRFRDA